MVKYKKRGLCVNFMTAVEILEERKRLKKTYPNLLKPIRNRNARINVMRRMKKAALANHA